MSAARSLRSSVPATRPPQPRPPAGSRLLLQGYRRLIPRERGSSYPRAFRLRRRAPTVETQPRKERDEHAESAGERRRRRRSRLVGGLAAPLGGGDRRARLVVHAPAPAGREE